MTPTTVSTTSALKEWDAQVQALAAGDVALVLRKGGILETHAGFEVEHRTFALYPTYLHQNPQELRPAFAGRLRPDPAPGTIVLPAVAEVRAVWRIEALDRALALEDLQALNAAAIERRFHYRGRPWLHALLLRVVPLREAIALPETPEMLGCLSWVPLEAGLEVTGPAAFDDARLDALHVEVAARLEAD